MQAGWASQTDSAARRPARTDGTGADEGLSPLLSASCRLIILSNGGRPLRPVNHVPNSL